LFFVCFVVPTTNRYGATVTTVYTYGTRITIGATRRDRSPVNPLSSSRARPYAPHRRARVAFRTCEVYALNFARNSPSGGAAGFAFVPVILPSFMFAANGLFGVDEFHSDDRCYVINNNGKMEKRLSARYIYVQVLHETIPTVISNRVGSSSLNRSATRFVVDFLPETLSNIHPAEPSKRTV